MPGRSAAGDVQGGKNLCRVGFVAALFASAAFKSFTILSRSWCIWFFMISRPQMPALMRRSVPQLTACRSLDQTVPPLVARVEPLALSSASLVLHMVRNDAPPSWMPT